MWLDQLPNDVPAPPQRGGNRVTFRLQPRQDAQKTIEAGRPIFEMVEYVKIQVPGDTTLIVDTPVRPEHVHEYRAQYQAFKANQDQDSASGTLLSASGLVTPERIEELAYFKVRTVEQYAAVSDGNIPLMGLNTVTERRRCRDFLEAAKSNAPLLRLQSQLDSAKSREEAMAKQMRELQSQVDSIRGKPTAALLAEAEAPMSAMDAAQAFQEAAPVVTPRKRGPKPKQAVAS